MNIYAESLGGRKCFGMEVICRDHCCPPRKTQKTQQSVSKREKYTKPSKTLQLQRFRSAIN